MLKIGEFSSLSRISIRMLRYYDENGLLKPTHIDSFTGYRYYEESQLDRAARIAALRDMGFGVAAIGGILHGGKETLEQALLLQKSALLEERCQVSRKLHLLETALKRLRKDEYPMKYEVTCKTLPARRVASVRDILPSYNYEGRLWHVMMQETAQMDLRIDTPCHSIGIYHDMDYRERDVDVEIQMSVQGQYADTEHVKFKTVPPVFMASTIHTGSYEEISGANIAVAEWVRDNGYAFNGPSFCIYHVSPHETQNPDELLTEVCFPIRAKQSGADETQAAESAC